jgi:hypothetical protein
VTETRQLLQHFLAALAYRAQKALRGAPDSFADFRVGPTTRTPHELLWHMTGVIGYARTMLRGGTFTPPRVSFAEEIVRFHDTLAALSADFADSALAARISDQQFLQGPLSDAMTHAGQLAMLRRLAGSPVASEDFIHADIRPGNVSADQPAPAAPDGWWRPDDPPQPPGAHLLHQREQDDAIPRRIVGFHTDEEGHWVADLECGHGQHVRHDPPWQNRPWVITPEGRARFLGTALRCRKCVNEGRRA